MKKVKLITLLFLVLITSCHQVKINNAPPGVNQQAVSDWYTATGAIQEVSRVAKQAPSVLKTLHSSGAFDDEYYVKALQLVKLLDEAGIHTTTVLQQSPNNFNQSVRSQILSDIQLVSNELVKFNNEGGTHIKNLASMTAINNLIASANLAVGVLQTLVQGGK